MNTGIELLVKRIKDCPDEFVGGEWNRLMDLFSNFVTAFTDEEKKAVDDALQEAKREVFTGRVMEIIANGEVIGDFQEKYTGFPAAPIKTIAPSKIAISPQQYNTLANNTLANNTLANSLSIGKETLTEQNLIDIKKKLANLK